MSWELCAFFCLSFSCCRRPVIFREIQLPPHPAPNQGPTLQVLGSCEYCPFIYLFIYDRISSFHPEFQGTAPPQSILSLSSYPEDSRLGGNSTIQFAFWISESRLGAKLSNPLYPEGAASQLRQEESSLGLHFLMSIYYLYMCVCVWVCFVLFFLSHWSVVCGCRSWSQPSRWRFQEKREFLGE